MNYILALDQGTTSSRAMVFDHDGNVHGQAQREFQQIYPKAGWVEHDPHEIWVSQISVAIEALGFAHAKPSDVAALGVTNQRETTIVWDRDTGESIYNAIVWQDRRTSAFCDGLKAGGHEELIRERTGLLIDAYFSASKLLWILDNVGGARKRAEAGKLAFGTVDSWLVWKLTRGERHIIDVTNASRTMLLNIHTRAWDDDLLRLFRIPPSVLPEVRSSSEVYGRVTTTLGLEDIVIAGIAGDQQAALFGQACYQSGQAKNTYGTGCFMLQHTGSEAKISNHRLLTTVACGVQGSIDYALEGGVFIGGAVVQWLRDGLGLIKSAADVEQLARSVPDNGGTYLVPAFAGLGAPHWDQYARGAMFGVTRGTTAGHLARAALEGIAFQVADLIDAMKKDSGLALAELRVDGGATENDLLMQIQADLIGIPVVRPVVRETTVLGAAYLAGLGVGFWNSPSELRSHWRAERVFEPAMPPRDASALRANWDRAIERTKGWEQGKE